MVDATIRAVRRHGATVGMDEIAAEAGTSKTVIYRYFDDKAGLYRAVADRIDQRVLRHIASALSLPDAAGPDTDAGADPNADSHASSHADSDAPSDADSGDGSRADPFGGPRALIASTVEAYLALVESDPEVYRFVVGRPLVDRPLDDDPVGGTVSQATDLLQQALVAGGVTTVRARVWALALVGAVQSVADDWLSSADRLPRAEAVGALADLAWSGLAAALHP